MDGDRGLGWGSPGEQGAGEGSMWGREAGAEITKTLVFCLYPRMIQFKGEYPFNFHRGVKDTFMSEKA